MELNKIFKALGIKGSPTEQVYQYIRKWQEWYEGNVKDFHDYTIFNGKRQVLRKRASLGMAKTVAETYADLLLNEKVEFTIKGKNEEGIFEVLKDSKFWTQGNQLVELSFALGTGLFVLVIEDMKISTAGTISFDDTKVRIKYIKASDIFPIDYSGGDITKLAIKTSKYLQVEKEMKEFVLLTVFTKKAHEFTGNEYWEIENILLDEKGSIVEVEDYMPEIAKNMILQTECPPFVLVKPNIVNSIDTNSPYGISAFAGSVDVLREIDTAWDSLINEFNLGKKRIFVDEKVLSFDDSGRPKVDDNDIVFYTLGGLIGDSESKMGDSIQESDLSLRVTEHVDGVKLGLDTLSRKTGLGSGYFSFDKSGAVTATEVVSRNSALFRSISKHSILLGEQLESLIESINAYINLINNTNYDVDVVIDFDDSVIEDEKAIEERALVELNSEIIDLHEYLKITRGYTDEMASDFIKEMEKRKGVSVEREEEDGDGTEI